MVDGITEAYRPAPVLTDGRDALELELLDEAGDQLDVPLQGVC